MGLFKDIFIDLQYIYRSKIMIFIRNNCEILWKLDYQERLCIVEGALCSGLGLPLAPYQATSPRALFVITAVGFLSQEDLMLWMHSCLFQYHFLYYECQPSLFHLICHFALDQFPFALLNIPQVSVLPSVTLPCRINWPATTPSTAFIMNYLRPCLIHLCEHCSKARTVLYSFCVLCCVLCTESVIQQEFCH